MRSSVSSGIGPGSTSPPRTMASTSAARTSASTASSAGMFAWMSLSTATRVIAAISVDTGPAPQFVGVVRERAVVEPAADVDGSEAGVPQQPLDVRRIQVGELEAMQEGSRQRAVAGVFLVAQQRVNAAVDGVVAIGV